MDEPHSLHGLEPERRAAGASLRFILLVLWLRLSRAEVDGPPTAQQSIICSSDRYAGWILDGTDECDRRWRKENSGRFYRLRVDQFVGRSFFQISNFRPRTSYFGPRISDLGFRTSPLYPRYGIVSGPWGRAATRASRPRRPSCSRTAAPISWQGIK
jgi:hypothetical protein